MKVLVGVDGSSNSFAAVEFIGKLLSPDRDALVLSFATPAIAFEDERLEPAVEERARLALSRTVLDAALERLPAVWRERATQQELAGSPSAALLVAVEEHEADLLVVGFRGTSRLEQFMLGSVSRAVVHSAKVPVLVVKGKPPAGKSMDHLHVLVAYDDKPTATLMAGLITRFAWPPESRGWVMTVVRPMFLEDLPDWVTEHPRDPDVAAMAAAWEQEYQQNLQTARGELEEYRATLPPAFARQGVIVAEGRPAEKLLVELYDKEIDLAVVGSRGSGAVARLLIGSTSSQVLADAPCSVLIVR